jgi:ABC-type glycerol-3-phosphate transport system substrate-binding protein
MNLANSWGIAGTTDQDSDYYYMVKDGEITPTIDTEEYRSYLEFMHKLSAENLMDKEGFTQTNDQYYAKLKSGLVGMWSGWTPYSVMAEEEAAKYVPVRVMQAAEGITPYKTGRQYKLFANRTGFAITKDCENPEKLLEWWNYLSSSTEIKYSMRYGPKGGYWDINEEGKVYQKTPEGLTADFTIENYKQTYGMNDKCTLILKDEDILVGEEDSFTSWYRVKLVDHVWDQLQTEYLPIRFSDPAKVDERTFMETELKEYVKNFTATAIMNGVDDAQWEAHLKQLEALKYYDWIQWYQDYHDGKF